MKNESPFLKFVLLTLSIISLPTIASATDMGGIFFVFAGMFLIPFLIGYLPYLFLSIKVAMQGGRPEGLSKSTTVWASVFAGINTLGFLVALFFVMEMGKEWLIAAVLLWGVPFLLFIKGVRSSPK